MAEVARLEGRFAIDGIRQAQNDIRQFDSAMRDAERSANRAADGIEKSAGGIGSSLASAAKAATLAGAAIGGGLLAAIGGSIKVAADFEKAIVDVGAASGATKDDLSAMRKEALKIGQDTSKSASEAVAAMGELTKAGVSVQDTVGGVARTVVQLAEATGIDMPEAANLVTNAMSIFKDEGLSASDAANIFAKAANASAIDVSQMGQSLSAVGPVAAAAGLTMQDFGTAIGLMGNNALRGSDAGTSLKAMLSGLTPNSKEAAGAMQQLGINAFNADGSFKSFRDIVSNLSDAFGPLNEQQRATYAEMIFGSDGVRALNILLKEGVDGWDAYGQAQAAADSVEEQSAKRRQSFLAQLEALKGSLETIAIEVGSVFLPALTQMTAFLAENIGPAFETLRTRLSGLWERVGPDATAAGQAIVSGLQSAATWITGTFLPAARQVAGDIWGEVGPKAQAAAQAIIDGIESARTWLNENGPGMASALVAAFERARSEIGPIISEIVTAVESGLSQIDTQAIEQEIAVSFENMTAAASRVDFSPLAASMAEARAEAERWSAFLNSDFSPAMANMGGAVAAGKAQIDQMLPSFVNLGNAAQVAGAVVSTVFGGAITMILAPIAALRVALESVNTVLRDGWVGAFQVAVNAYQGLMTLVPGGRGILEGLRSAIDAVGQAASGAAGFVSGLASGISSMASAASSAVGPLRSALGAFQEIGGALGRLGALMPGSLPPLAQGFKDTGEQAQIAAGGLGDMRNALQDVGQFGTNTLNTWARSTSALVDYSTQLRAAESSLRDLNAELRQLKLAQAMDPQNEALAEQIKGLQFTINVQRDLTQTLKDSVAGWQAETFAIDGFVQALNTLNVAGPQALKIQEQFLKALTENDFSAGTDLASGIQKMIADATKTLTAAPDLLAPIQALGQQVLDAFQSALSDPNESTINAAMGLLTNLTAAINQATQANAEQIAAAGRFTAENFARAMVGEESKAQLGSAGASMMEALASAMEENTPKATASAANAVRSMQDELRKLPEYVRGRLGTEMQQALDAFLANPTEDALNELRPIIERINDVIDLIPDGVSDAAPEVVREIESIIKAFAELGGSAEDAGKQIAGVMDRAKAAAKEASSTTSKLGAEQEAKLTEHTTGLVKPTNFVAPSSSGGGGGSSKAGMFAAAVASPGGWTPALAGAFFDGLDQIAKHAADQSAAIQAGMKQMGDTMQNFDAVIMSSRGIFGGGEGGTRSSSNFIPSDFLDFGSLMRDAANRGLTAQANLIAQRMYDGQVEIADAIAALSAILGGKGAGQLGGIIDYGAIRAAVRDGVADALGGRGVGGVANAEMTNMTRRTIA